MEIHLTVREEKDMTRGLPGTLGTSGNKLASVNSSINQSINQLCNIRGQVDMWQNYEVLPHFQLAYIYKYICVWTWYDSKKNRVNLGIWFNWVTPSHVMGHHKREDRYIYLAFLVRSSWDWERLPPLPLHHHQLEYFFYLRDSPTRATIILPAKSATGDRLLSRQKYCRTKNYVLCFPEWGNL